MRKIDVCIYCRKFLAQLRAFIFLYTDDIKLNLRNLYPEVSFCLAYIDVGLKEAITPQDAKY